MYVYVHLSRFYHWFLDIEHFHGRLLSLLTLKALGTGNLMESIDLNFFLNLGKPGEMLSSHFPPCFNLLKKFLKD